MLEYLIDIDTAFFLAVNGLHSSAFDHFVKAFSGKVVWVPLYISIAYAIIRAYGWRSGIIAIIFIGVACGASDATCSHIIRPLVERMRPSNPDNPLSALVHIVDGYRGGRYGFPSCHATNTFALALSSGLMLRNKYYFIFIILWAITQCYSRLYLGVHFPGDLLVGAAIGSGYGYLVCYLSRQLRGAPNSQSPYIWSVPIGVGILTICLLAIFS